MSFSLKKRKKKTPLQIPVVNQRITKPIKLVNKKRLRLSHMFLCKNVEHFIRVGCRPHVRKHPTDVQNTSLSRLHHDDNPSFFAALGMNFFRQFCWIHMFQSYIVGTV